MPRVTSRSPSPSRSAACTATHCGHVSASISCVAKATADRQYRGSRCSMCHDSFLRPRVRDDRSICVNNSCFYILNRWKLDPLDIFWCRRHLRLRRCEQNALLSLRHSCRTDSDRRCRSSQEHLQVPIPIGRNRRTADALRNGLLEKKVQNNEKPSATADEAAQCAISHFNASDRSRVVGQPLPLKR